MFLALRCDCVPIAVCRITVQRLGGDLSGKCSVRYRTVDGTAVAGIDYEPIEVRAACGMLRGGALHLRTVLGS